jgi:hypothetical protein
MAALNYWCKTCGGWRTLSHVHGKRARVLSVKRTLSESRAPRGRQMYRLVIEEKDESSGVRALVIRPQTVGVATGEVAAAKSRRHH